MSRAVFLSIACTLCACQPVQEDSGLSVSAIRPDQLGASPNDPRFDQTETVETWVSPGGRVKLHFSRTGRNAVPARDDDTSGVPDYVELAGRTYDEVRDLYHGPLGLREPVSDALLMGVDDGGDDLFDVYLVDFNGRGDGAFRQEVCKTDRPGECAGFMFQENDFLGYGYPTLRYACRVLASHEYFHAVQAAYDSGQDSIFNESTATWAVERFDDELQDFEGFIEAYLTRTDRSLNVVSGGVTDAKSYGTAIFFQFLAEAYDPLVVPKLLAEVADGANAVANPEWYTRLDPFLQREYQVSFADAFTQFSIWNLYTNSRADATKSYAKGFGYPLVSMDEVELPYELGGPRFFPASARYFRVDIGGRGAITAALSVSEDELDQLENLSLHLAVLRGNRLDDPIKLADARAGTETVDTSGADRVIAFVVNTNPDGNSKRPDLCIGAVSEVAACLSKNIPETDAGVEDSGVTGDADAGVPADSGVAMPPPVEEEGGCSAIDPKDSAALWLAVAFFVALTRKRSA
jgi:hypothetical protein